MLTGEQTKEILTQVFNSFRLQKGLEFNPDDFDIIVDKPNFTSMCSLRINSKRKDDQFRIKLYVKNFTNYTSLTSFILLQEQSYATGGNDEVFVADCSLNKNTFASFYRYLLSPQFYQDIAQSTDNILLEDGSGSLLNEQGNGKLILEN